MWLLDANMPVDLVQVLRELKIESDSASKRGWRQLTNGDLVSEASSAGFTCLLTRDRLFGQSAAKALQRYPDFAVVLIGIAQRPWGEYRSRFLEAWRNKPIDPIAGSMIVWP